MTTTMKAGPEHEVGAYLHNAAWRQRITHTQMGAAIGVQQSTLSKKLRGLTPLTVGEMFVLAELLDVEPTELVLRACRDSNPKPSDP